MTSGAFDGEGLSSVLARHGLVVRGGFDFDPGEVRPAGPSGAPARCVLLIGHAGGAAWPHFSSWLGRQATKPADPLDTWSAEVIGAGAARFGARAVFPWEKPYQPFQQWAMRAEELRPSPLGLLIHPEYGLWHAYRGALLLETENPIQHVQASIHPCDRCVEKPCLSACPVNAFAIDGFDVAGCRSYLDSIASQSDSTSRSTQKGGPDCMREGCRARDACPVGRGYRYPDAQVRFHMAAFVRARWSHAED